MEESKNRYPLEDMPFHKLQTKKRLARILLVKLNELTSLSQGEERYQSFNKKKDNGTFRAINAPSGELKKVQARIAYLFGKVIPPDFLHAPISGRSYVTNAKQHIGANAICCLDIKDFFPNCTINKVRWFFRAKLKCSHSVSFILSNIVTFNGSLPQGSPCSPILAYYCYMDMWEEIAVLVKRYNCKLTVYADDLTISGNLIYKKMIWEIKKLIYKHGHRHARDKERVSFGRPMEVTGVIVGKDSVRVPNRRYKKLHEARALEKHCTWAEKKKLKMQISGRLAQIRQVNNANRNVP